MYVTVNNFYSQAIGQNVACKHTKAFKDKGINGNYDGYTLCNNCMPSNILHQAVYFCLLIRDKCAKNIDSFDKKAKINEVEIRDSLISIRISA